MGIHKRIFIKWQSRINNQANHNNWKIAKIFKLKQGFTYYFVILPIKTRCCRISISIEEIVLEHQHPKALCKDSMKKNLPIQQHMFETPHPPHGMLKQEEDIILGVGMVIIGCRACIRTRISPRETKWLRAQRTTYSLL